LANYQLAEALVFSGRFEKAIQQSQKVMAIAAELGATNCQ
jgi:hypothetical protein